MSEGKLIRVIHKVAAYIEGRSYRPGDEAVIAESHFNESVHTLAEGETLTPTDPAQKPPHPVAAAVQALADENDALKARVAELQAELQTRPPAPPPAPDPVPFSAPAATEQPTTPPSTPEGTSAATPAPGAGTDTASESAGGAT